MESVFRQVGSCVCFQVCHVACVQFARLISGWAMYIMAFGNYEPPWHCVTRADNSSSYSNYDNSTTFKEFAITINTSNIMTRLSDFEPMSDNLNSALKAAFPYALPDNSTGFKLTSESTGQYNAIEIVYNGTCNLLPTCSDVIFEPSSVTLVSEFGLICDRAYIPSVIISSQMLGMLLGDVIGGQCGELLGRKVTLYSHLALLSATCILASWSTSWEMHAVVTFFIGYGIAGVYATYMVYTVEFLTPKWRGRFMSIPLWPISMTIFSCVVFALRHWRHLYMVIGVIAATAMLGAIWVPESVRWLHVHGKDKDTRKVLGKIMKANNCKTDVSTVFEMLRNTDEQRIAENEQDPGSSSNPSTRRYTYLDLFRHPKIRILTLKSSCIMLSVMICINTLAFSVKSLPGDFYTNFILVNMFELPFLVILSLSINRFGRKVSLVIFKISSVVFIVTCVVLLTITVNDIDASETAIQYLALLARASGGSAWTVVSVFTLELFPTVLRSLTVGFMNMVTRIASIFAAFLIPRDHDSIIVCFCVIGAALIISCFLTLTLPETKGKPLIDDIGQLSQRIDTHRQRNANEGAVGGVREKADDCSNPVLDV